MSLRFLLPIFLLPFASISCNQSTEPRRIKKTVLLKSETRSFHPKRSKVSKPSFKESDTTTTIKFKEFNIVISRLIASDDDGQLKAVQSDSCQVVNDIGETVLGQTIKIIDTSLQDLKIEQRFETSASIANEGPHCDLINWKHYTSPWVESPKIAPATFKCRTYSEDEQKLFPTTSTEEFQQYVKEHCGIEWYELKKDNKEVKQGASWVGVSKVYLRITGIERTSGKRIVKLIFFEEAMGC